MWADAVPERGGKVPLPIEIQQTEEALDIYNGLAIAMRDPHAVLDVVLQAGDVGDAREALRERLGLDEFQASAVLDMQFRRATDVDRRRIEDRARELAEHLSFLRSLSQR